jgi:hypothetical protein
VSCTPNYVFNLADFLTILNRAFKMIEKFKHGDLNLSFCEEILMMKVCAEKITLETNSCDFFFCEKYSWE